MDLDRAYAYESGYYFSHMIALNIPDWVNPDFYVDLSSMGVASTNPNTVFPKLVQYYMENIIRQNVDVPRIAELAFYKALNKCGLAFSDIQSRIVFANKIVTENFYQTENNNGWSEILGVIPNKCNVMNPVFKTVAVPEIIQSTDIDGMFDNGDKQFLFPEDARMVFDFEKMTYDDTTVKTFDFNVLLLFYKDEDGVDKLHGINFIFPFENKITYFLAPRLTQKTNDARSIGYQFLFNMKSCNNEASKTMVYEWNGQAFYNTFERTMSLLNQFLEVNASTKLK